MKLFSLLVVAAALAGVSCERHEFEGPDGTKQLHQHHSAGAPHGEHEEAAAKDEETEEGDVKDGRVLKH